MLDVARELHQSIFAPRESWSRLTMMLCLLGSLLGKHVGSVAFAYDALVFGSFR